MNKTAIDRRKTTFFSSLSNDLVYNQQDLLDFINQPFSIEAFNTQIEQKSKNFPAENRSILVEELLKKYQSVEENELSINNINRLKESSTYTITTGHQLNILTGPIFFIYKILNTIKLSKDLNEKHPNNHFVPVFWMATEDHDFEEIQETKIFNNTFKWETKQKGAVGRIYPENIDSIRQEFKSLFQNSYSDEIEKIIDSINGKNLSEINFNLVHELFCKFGLVIIDADSHQFKKLFQSTLIKEVKEQFAIDAVNQTNEKLSLNGYKSQAHARIINLFYLTPTDRIKIEKTANNTFSIEGVGEFNESELIAKIEKTPENFSPNVILRPVYQETILPNLCYIGGGGEIAYWLQLKNVFERAHVTFPLIQVRNSIQIIEKGTFKKISKLNLRFEDFLKDIDELKKEVLSDTSQNDLEFTTLDEKLFNLIGSMKEVSSTINSQLESYTASETTKLIKQIEGFKKKLIRTEKEKYDIQLNAIEAIYDKLFPNNGLQERSYNFFNLCKDGAVKKHINELYDCIDPSENDLIVLTDNN